MSRPGTHGQLRSLRLKLFAAGCVTLVIFCASQTPVMLTEFVPHVREPKIASLNSSGQHLGTNLTLNGAGGPEAASDTSELQVRAQQPEEDLEEVVNVTEFLSAEEAHKRRIEELMDLMAARGRYMKDQCRSLGDDAKRNPRYTDFFYFKRFGLLYCPVYKAGTTTLRSTFILAAGFTFKMNRAFNFIDNARRFYPTLSYPQFTKVAQDTLTLIVVRHPWTRLLSCYKHKLEHRQKYDPYFMNELTPKIKLNTRPFPEGTTASKKVIFFNQLKQHMKYGRPMSADNPFRLQPLVTFKEFLKHVASHPEENAHWTPAHITCSTCNNLLDYSVSKFEDYGTEMTALLEKVGVDKSLLIHENPTMPSNYTSIEKAEIVQKYYSDIDMPLRKQLYNIFRNDFILFDYNPDQFFKVTT